MSNNATAWAALSPSLKKNQWSHRVVQRSAFSCESLSYIIPWNQSLLQFAGKYIIYYYCCALFDHMYFSTQSFLRNILIWAERKQTLIKKKNQAPTKTKPIKLTRPAERTAGKGEAGRTAKKEEEKRSASKRELDLLRGLQARENSTCWEDCNYAKQGRTQPAERSASKGVRSKKFHIDSYWLRELQYLHLQCLLLRDCEGLCHFPTAIVHNAMQHIVEAAVEQNCKLTHCHRVNDYNCSKK